MLLFDARECSARRQTFRLLPHCVLLLLSREVDFARALQQSFLVLDRVEVQRGGDGHSLQAFVLILFLLRAKLLLLLLDCFRALVESQAGTVVICWRVSQLQVPALQQGGTASDLLVDCRLLD